jgi:hypothetical protein
MTGSTLGRTSRRFSGVETFSREGLVRVRTQSRVGGLHMYAAWIGASVEVEP